MISQNRFSDITKSFRFFDIKNLFCDIKKIEFVISQNRGFIVKRHLIQFVFSTLWFSERKTNSAQTDFFTGM